MLNRKTRGKFLNLVCKHSTCSKILSDQHLDCFPFKFKKIMQEDKKDHQTTAYKALLNDLAKIGGKSFLEAASNYLAENEKYIGMGDGRLTYRKNESSRYRSQESIDEIETITTFSLKHKMLKPHYEMSTKLAEMRKQDTMKMRAALSANPVIPFVAGTSINQSHNILLNCQHILAEKMNEPTAGGDAPASNTKPKTMLSSEFKKKFKVVLKNIYQDFMDHSREYDELLSVLSMEGIDKTQIKTRLKNLEQLMDKKQQELTALIFLFQEVCSLSQQLLQSKSLQSLPPKTKKSETSATFKLNFLQQQIQKLKKLSLKPS